MISDWSDERTTNNLTVSAGHRRGGSGARGCLFLYYYKSTRGEYVAAADGTKLYIVLSWSMRRAHSRAWVCGGDVAAQFVGLSKFNLAKVRLNSVRAHLASVFVCARPVFLRCGFYYYCHFFFLTDKKHSRLHLNNGKIRYLLKYWKRVGIFTRTNIFISIYL